MAYCKNCGAEVSDIQEICVKCGVKVGMGTSYCAHCGKDMPAGADVCMGCGCAVKKATPAAGDLGGQDKVTMAVVCFFLGGLGIHNFMMKETKKGIFKIAMTCCFGIGCILALIDFIKLLTDNYVVDPEKLV